MRLTWDDKQYTPEIVHVSLDHTGERYKQCVFVSCTRILDHHTLLDANWIDLNN